MLPRRQTIHGGQTLTELSSILHHRRPLLSHSHERPNSQLPDTAVPYRDVDTSGQPDGESGASSRYLSSQILHPSRSSSSQTLKAPSTSIRTQKQLAFLQTTSTTNCQSNFQLNEFLEQELLLLNTKRHSATKKNGFLQHRLCFFPSRLCL
jgi:hypothetical protein